MPEPLALVRLIRRVTGADLAADGSGSFLTLFGSRGDAERAAEFLNGSGRFCADVTPSDDLQDTALVVVSA